jgi:hypothetical protein
MVGGFNTNVRYRGRVFHVQTEDSGPTASRMVITLVYEGGVILSSKKTRYEAVSDPNERQKIVRELMECQHAEIVRALKGGELDAEVGLRSGHGPGRAASEHGTSGSVPTRAREAAAAPDERFGGGIISEVPLDQVVLAYLGVR